MIIRATGRTVLRASAGVLALRFAPMRSAATSVQHQSDLFAFRAPGTGNLVFAVVYSAIGSSRFDVHIHTGRKRWAVNGLRPQQTGTMMNRRGEHLFSGEILARRSDVATRYNAVVLESPPDFVRTGESLAIWAKLRAEDGSHLRVGSPFVAGLLARDQVLSNTYHAASPTEDRALFSDAVAKRFRSPPSGADTRQPSCARSRPSARSSARSRRTCAATAKLLVLFASTISRLASRPPRPEDHATGHRIVDFDPSCPPQGCPGSIGITVRLASESASAFARNPCPPSLGIRNVGN